VISGSHVGRSLTPAETDAAGPASFWKRSPTRKIRSSVLGVLSDDGLDGRLCGAEYPFYIRLPVLQHETHAADELTSDADNSHALRHPFTVGGEGI
jgi:hypothetical protein